MTAEVADEKEMSTSTVLELGSVASSRGELLSVEAEVI